MLPDPGVQQWYRVTPHLADLVQDRPSSKTDAWEKLFCTFAVSFFVICLSLMTFYGVFVAGRLIPLGDISKLER